MIQIQTEEAHELYVIPWWESAIGNFWITFVNIFLHFSCFNVPSLNLKIAWMIWMFKWILITPTNLLYKSDLTSSSHIWKCLQSTSVLLILVKYSSIGKPLDFVYFFFFLFPFLFTYPHPYHIFRVASFKDKNTFYIYILKASQDTQYQKQLRTAELICTCPKHAYLHINTITLN